MLKKMSESVWVGLMDDHEGADKQRPYICKKEINSLVSRKCSCTSSVLCGATLRLAMTSAD